MRHDVLIPFHLAPSGSTRRAASTAAVRRLASRVLALIASDHLALRLAASAWLVGGLALAVSWAVSMVAGL